MKTINFRLVQEADAEEILGIYEPYIKDTAITFEYETPSVDEFRSRIREISSDYPYIVCVSDSKIIGYAYAHRQMERAAYQWNAELSVYIDKACLRCGVGKALYSALIEILQMQNVRSVYGGVTSPNENSEKLHEYFGFKKLGVYHSTGYKCGAWHDVAWFEKTIGDYCLAPKPFVSIQEIDKNVITEILNRYNEPHHSK
ncbi:GNAT family N-acetyltransferase [Desulfitobacterium sp. Sab5]|uniref:GNAT family N-acetyltransferase n=1 Tax=Desulfitobacterium nosdiversum TaxID=3375356 RepID=UPI003CED85DA